MLVISRKPANYRDTTESESTIVLRHLVTGERIEVHILKAAKFTVRCGIEASIEWKIARKEVEHNDH